MTTRLNLRMWLTQPRRRTTITIATVGIGLLALLPISDVYSGCKQQREELESALAQARLSKAQLGQYEKSAKEVTDRLESWQARTLAGPQAHGFRQQAVEVVRACGCRLVRLRTGTSQTRPWIDGQSPFRSPTPGARPADPPAYTVILQPLFLSVSGTTANLTKLLARLDGMDWLFHTQSITVSQASKGDNELLLDLELTLFGLEEAG